jgi:thiol:disulfide interchange protein DsbD
MTASFMLLPASIRTSLLRFLGLLFLCLPLFSQALSQDELLPPEKAFSARLSQQGQNLVVHFEVAQDYYLYRDRMHFTGQPGGVIGQPQFPQGKTKQDKFFGQQVIYPHPVDVVIPVTGKLPAGFTLKTSFQGCANVGVCYPPQTQLLKPGETLNPLDILGGALRTSNTTPLNNGSTNGAPPQLGTGHWLTTLGTFWLAGLGMAFTACLYPLLPIASAIITGQGAHLSRRRGGGLAFAYVQGLALTYTVIGVIAGLTGSLLMVWMQQPAVVLSASFLMVLLALSMFDVFSLQLPTSLQSRLAETSNRLPGGRWLTVFATGVLSALIIGPCVAPPLALALGYIGATGDATMGGAALYAMALGIGSPLLVLGFFGGHVLPKTGAWMKAVKAAFGVVMLALAVWIATPFLPGTVVMLLWAALAMGTAVFLQAFDPLPSNAHTMQRLGKAVGLFLFVVGAAQLVGALSGQTNPRTPLKSLISVSNAGPAATAAKLNHVSISSPAELDQALLTHAARPLLVDFYADWCVACHELENKTLTDPKVAAALQGYTLLRIDMTANLPEHQALLKRFGLFGPPGLILMRHGKEVDRVIGYIEPGEFLPRLNAPLGSGVVKS